MNRVLKTLMAALLLCASGCMSVKFANDFKDVKVEEGRVPKAIVEIENSVWLLLNFIPVGSGNPDVPNKNTCRWFKNTVSLQNNMKVLRATMDEHGIENVANLTSRYADEKYLFFLLARRACHTSAVLVISDKESKTK